MKNTINTFFLVIFSISLNAQVKIGDNPNNFNNDAMLEIESSNKGLLIPRVNLWTTDAATPLTSHVEGMVVYNRTINMSAIPDPLFEGLYYNNGTKWVKMMALGGTGASGGDGDAWGVNGEDKTSGIGRSGDISIHRNNGYPTFLSMTISNNQNHHPTFMGHRSRFDINNNSTFPNTNDVLAAFIGRDGLGGPSNYGGGEMRVVATENYSNTAKGSRLVFLTTNNSSGVPTEKVTIGDNGNVGIGTSTPFSKLHIRPSILNDPSTMTIENDFARPSISFVPTKLAGLNPYYPNVDHTWDIYPHGIFGSPSSANSVFGIVERRGNNTTEFFSIASTTGNVGIGTTSPSQKLEVTGDVLAKSISASWSNLTSDGGLELYRDVSTSGSNHVNGFIDFHSSPSSDFEGRLFYGTKLTPSLNKEGYIFSFSNNGTGTSDYPMVILRNGNVGIGGKNNGFFTGNPSTGYMTDLNARLVVSGRKDNFSHGLGITYSGGTGVVAASGGTTINTDGPSQAIITAGSDGVTYTNDWPLNWGGGLATWDIVGSGCFFGTYVQRSDAKLKKDILSMDLSITEKLMKLRPVTYFMKKETPELEGLQYGFIAQEVREIFPTIVTKAPEVENSIIGMNYSALIAPTVYVVQQQQKMIEDLKRENEEIKAQLKLIMESIKK